MAGDRIAVPYNHKLKRLEALLAGVERAGDFFVQGSLDAPIPRVEIDGIGVLSFRSRPRRLRRSSSGRVARRMAAVSTRLSIHWSATPGSSTRRCVRIGGKAWEKTFHQIMLTVIAGLGCSGTHRGGCGDGGHAS